MEVRRDFVLNKEAYRDLLIRRALAPLTKLFKDKTEAAIFFTAFLVEIAFGLYLIYRWGHTFVTADAFSHSYIPRTVVNNGAQSNFANLGTVWLPMFHLLVMPLVLIDPLYTTGFAGTIVNALATGGICVILYRLIGNKRLGILASALYMGNAFTLIYGATPMMEQTAVFFTLLAVYYFKRYWETDSVIGFMKCSIALIFGTLTRYEVWALAFFIIFFFVLRELKNGQRHRLAYAHLPLWGIFAWLFWNLAIFRNPIEFMVHMTGLTPVEAFAPSALNLERLYLTFVSNFLISGHLYILIPVLVIFCIAQKKYSELVATMLLATPLLFQVAIKTTGISLTYYLRYFYLGFAGMVSIPFFLCNNNNFGRNTKVAVLITAIVSYSFAIQPQLLLTNQGFVSYTDDANFPKYSRLREEVMAIKSITRESTILASTATGYASSALYSVTTGTSPSQLIDDFDNPMYTKVMNEPWKFVSYVIIEKMSPDIRRLKALNEYYNGKYFVYRFYNDDRWRSEFLSNYIQVLETKNYLLFELVKEGD